MAGLRTVTRFERVILVLAAGAALWAAARDYQGDHASSRLATVYSLTEFGTWYIDRPSDQAPNPFEQQTIDKVMVRGQPIDGAAYGGRIISSKPPILPLLMTAEYIALKALTGWDLDEPTHARKITLVLTLTYVGGAYLLTQVLFLKTLYLLDCPAVPRGFLLTALAFGTEMWGFSGTINNHVPAAALLMVVLHSVVGLLLGRLSPKPGRFLLVGVCGGLVSTIDMPLGIYVALAALALLRRFPRPTLGWVLMGGLVPVAIHAGIMLTVTGSPLPVQLHKSTYLYESAYWRHPLGIDALNEPKWTYLFHVTFGRCGVFSLFPVLLLGAIAFMAALLHRPLPYRSAILAGGAGCLVLIAYYVSSTNNYGGESYGFRWLIGSMPVLLLMGSVVAGRSVRIRHRVLLAVMLLVSFYSSWECVRAGWNSGTEWTSAIFGPAYAPVTNGKTTDT